MSTSTQAARVIVKNMAHYVTMATTTPQRHLSWNFGGSLVQAQYWKSWWVSHALFSLIKLGSSADPQSINMCMPKTDMYSLTFSNIVFV